MTAEVTTSRRRAVGRTLLILSALGAAGFAGWSLAQLQQATPQELLSQSWHAFGLIVFAGLFALVAWRPRAYPGLMELTITHSVGIFTLALVNQNATGSTATMILHGLLGLALVIAYVVLGCIKAWRPQPSVTTAAAPAPRGKAAASRPHKQATSVQEKMGTVEPEPGLKGQSDSEPREPESSPRSLGLDSGSETVTGEPPEQTTR